MYTLVTVHLVLTLTATAMVWLSFIILVSICAAAHQDRGIDSVKSMEEGGVRVSIGPSPWILLTGCIVSCFWVWETLRWRHAEYVKRAALGATTRAMPEGVEARDQCGLFRCDSLRRRETEWTIEVCGLSSNQMKHVQTV